MLNRIGLKNLIKHINILFILFHLYIRKKKNWFWYDERYIYKYGDLVDP